MLHKLHNLIGQHKVSNGGDTIPEMQINESSKRGICDSNRKFT